MRAINSIRPHPRHPRCFAAQAAPSLRRPAAHTTSHRCLSGVRGRSPRTVRFATMSSTDGDAEGGAPAAKRARPADDGATGNALVVAAGGGGTTAAGVAPAAAAAGLAVERDRGIWFGHVEAWLKSWLDEDGDGLPGRPWAAVDTFYAAAINGNSYTDDGGGDFGCGGVRSRPGRRTHIRSDPNGSARCHPGFGRCGGQQLEQHAALSWKPCCATLAGAVQGRRRAGAGGVHGRVRHRLCLVLPLPSWSQQRHCLVLPPLRNCLSLCFHCLRG